jgi:hypothetical protein
MLLAGARVLLAYGLLGEVFAGLRPLGFDYMGAHLDWLRAEGAEARVVRVPTAAPVAANARALRRALLAEERPALIIAHSKGGLEALAALMDEAAAARCAGLLAMQSPFYGTPLADLVPGLTGAEAGTRALARLLGIGSGEGVLDLTTARRRAWMDSHAEAIARLVARVPVGCLATEIAPGQVSGRERLHLLAARWLAARGAGPNDGLVPVASALLPGARHLVRPGSHIATVSTGAGRDPVAMLREGLALIEA